MTCFPFTKQHSGDDVARNEEEDVNPDVSTGDTGHAGVVQDHEQNCDGAETLNVRPEWAVAWCGAGFVPRSRVSIRCRDRHAWALPPWING